MCCAMACAVWVEGIGWASPPLGIGPLLIDLGVAVSSGAAVYCGTLLTVWWLCGKPAGAETMLLSLASDTWRHTVANPFRRRA